MLQAEHWLFKSDQPAEVLRREKDSFKNLPALLICSNFPRAKTYALHAKLKPG